MRKFDYSEYEKALWDTVIRKHFILICTGGCIVKRVGKPNGKVTLIGTYDVDHNAHIVYSLGVDESGEYYSVEEHEYNIGSAYSFYREYYILDNNEVIDLRQRAEARKRS